MKKRIISFGQPDFVFCLFDFLVQFSTELQFSFIYLKIGQLVINSSFSLFTLFPLVFRCITKFSDFGVSRLGLIINSLAPYVIARHVSYYCNNPRKALATSALIPQKDQSSYNWGSLQLLIKPSLTQYMPNVGLSAHTLIRFWGITILPPLKFLTSLLGPIYLGPHEITRLALILCVTTQGKRQPHLRLYPKRTSQVTIGVPCNC